MNPRRPTSPCVWCPLLPPYVRAVRSAFALPGGAAESIVHALKYDGWSALGGAMARRMAGLRFPPDVERERAALVPVPLAPRRQATKSSDTLELGLSPPPASG